MRRIFWIILAALCAAGFAQICFSAEHGGEAMGTQEKTDAMMQAPPAQPEEVTAQPSAAPTQSPEPSSASQVAAAAVAGQPNSDDVRQTVETYIKEQAVETGTLDIYDPVKEELRELTLVKVNEQAGQSGNYYHICADFKDNSTGEMIDLDFDLENIDGKLNVIDEQIHKVNDAARFNYDDKGNRIPVAASAAVEEKPSTTQGAQEAAPEGATTEKAY